MYCHRFAGARRLAEFRCGRHPAWPHRSGALCDSGQPINHSIRAAARLLPNLKRIRTLARRQRPSTGAFAAAPNDENLLFLEVLRRGPEASRIGMQSALLFRTQA